MCGSSHVRTSTGNLTDDDSAALSASSLWRTGSSSYSAHPHSAPSSCGSAQHSEDLKRLNNSKLPIAVAWWVTQPMQMSVAFKPMYQGLHTLLRE